MEYKNRSDVPNEYKWDLTKRYKTDADFEQCIKKAKKSIKNILNFKGNVLTSVDTLKETLDAYYKEEANIIRLYSYASLKHDEDLANAKYSLYVNETYTLYTDFISNSSYIIPEILNGSKTLLNRYLKNKKLSIYKHTLEDIIRHKDHTLSSSEETLVSKLSKTEDIFEKTSSILKDSIIEYGEIEVDGTKTQITSTNYYLIMQNKNRETRKQAYELVSKKMKEFAPVFGELLIGNMKNCSIYANIKNYKSVLDMKTFSSNVSTKINENLIKTVNKRLDVYQKYFRHLKHHLGLEKLYTYDFKAEMLKSNESFSIEDTKLLISEATKIYGDEYHDIILKAFNEKWIDFMSYKGKSSSIYSEANYGDTPVIHTSFHGKFYDVSTLAHELGHAVNFYLSIENSHAHDYDIDRIACEIPSLTNEIILSNYIYTHSNKKELKLMAINNLISIIENNLFSACLQGELENIAYNKLDNNEEIDSEFMSNQIMELKKKYYGKEVELKDNDKYIWTRIHHYYCPFYLYEYAIGISCAIYIANKIINNEDNMKEKYLNFLKNSGKSYVTDLLSELGIDTTQPKLFNDSIDYFNYLLDMFEKVSEE